MKQLLAKRFIRNTESDPPERVRSAYGVLSGCVGIFFNLLLFAIKFIFGLLARAVSLQADAFNNLGDAGSSIIALFGFRLASKKPDRDHPYGHGRFEYVSGLVVSILIIIMGYSLFRNAISILIYGGETAYSSHFVPTLVVMIASILIKLYLFAFNRSLAKQFSSPTLRAVAFDSLSDSIATAVVLLCAVISRFVTLPDWLRLDALCGILVSLFIIYTGLKSAKETMEPLLGRRPDPAFVSAIESAVLSFEGIGGVHDIVVHDYGPGRVFVSLHAEVPEDGNVRELHDIIDSAEKYLCDRFQCTATIHMDPIITDDPRTEEMKRSISDYLHTVDPRLTIHDFRIANSPDGNVVLFDVVLPYDYPDKEQELLNGIEQTMKTISPTCRTVVEIDRADA